MKKIYFLILLIFGLLNLSQAQNIKLKGNWKAVKIKVINVTPKTIIPLNTEFILDDSTTMINYMFNAFKKSYPDSICTVRDSIALFAVIENFYTSGKLIFKFDGINKLSVLINEKLDAKGTYQYNIQKKYWFIISPILKNLNNK